MSCLNDNEVDNFRMKYVVAVLEKELFQYFVFLLSTTLIVSTTASIVPVSASVVRTTGSIVSTTSLVVPATGLVFPPIL
ncbi:hypothetical protein MTR67_052355 [Solanum verrucosum]|uniref:Transmembrane protein n=1 Tax=Solanum verrucosum TaxID=315347 RepID=A0AAF1A370_SOLVR|nr:hypothetical protein MTR67_052355 [Solanum verrucosum]